MARINLASADEVDPYLGSGEARPRPAMARVDLTSTGEVDPCYGWAWPSLARSGGASLALASGRPEEGEGEKKIQKTFKNLKKNIKKIAMLAFAGWSVSKLVLAGQFWPDGLNWHNCKRFRTKLTKKKKSLKLNWHNCNRFKTFLVILPDNKSPIFKV